jgi:hypothetical protein
MASEPKTKLPAKVVDAARTVALGLLVDGRTKRSLAAELGEVHETNFGKFVNGRHGVGPRCVVRLAALGGYDPAAIFDGELIATTRVARLDGFEAARAAVARGFPEHVLEAGVRALDAVGATSISKEILFDAASFALRILIGLPQGSPPSTEPEPVGDTRTIESVIDEAKAARAAAKKPGKRRGAR